MPKAFIVVVSLALLPMAALSVSPASTTDAPKADAAEGLLSCCSDIPEIVALVAELRIREDRIAKALSSLDEKNAEIATARSALLGDLRRLKSTKNRTGRSKTHDQQSVEDDISRLVAVYESMKPKDAAVVMAALPPKFSAEILMRVSPEVSARIIAAIEPEKAAILTTYMGARSASLN